MKNAQSLALLTSIFTVVLIGLGAYVRATGSGLGCPDWPTCHGGAVPPGDEKAIIEYSHRFVASLVGLMVIGTAILAWKHYRHAPFVLWTAIAAVPLVGFQGILGAITVWHELPEQIVATHLLMAMLVLSCELAVWVGMYQEDPDRRAGALSMVRERVQPAGAMAIVALLWMAGVLWIGGFMAEYGASTACTDWPTCNGTGIGDIFPANENQEVVHMVHRYLAGAFIFFIVPAVWMLWVRRKEIPYAAELGVLTAVLYVAQVAVGALNVWYTFPDLLTVSHTAIAGGIWYTLSAAALFALYVPAAEQPAVARGKGKTVRVPA